MLRVTAALVAAVAVLVAFTLPPRRRILSPLSDGAIPGILHVHTNRSDGLSGPDEVAAAVAAGLAEALGSLLIELAPALLILLMSLLFARGSALSGPEAGAPRKLMNQAILIGLTLLGSLVIALSLVVLVTGGIVGRPELEGDRRHEQLARSRMDDLRFIVHARNLVVLRQT